MSHQTFVTTDADAGQRVLGWLARRLNRPAGELVPLFDARRVTLNGSPARPDMRLRAGQRVEVRLLEVANSPRSPARQPANPPTRLSPAMVLHRDADLLVVNKPAGLTTSRSADEAREFGRGKGKYLPPTLADLLPELLRQLEPNRPPVARAVHRLDRDTTGAVVFARTVEAERHLGQQFRVHSIERTYVALVRGRVREGRIESWLVEDRGDHRRGSGPEGEGQHAVTHVRLVESLGEFALVECRLETGRTHQVRIHLGEAGTPICGERVYDRPIHGRPLADGSGADRVMLHARSLVIDHPTRGERMEWVAPVPRDFERLLGRLRSRNFTPDHRGRKPDG